MRMFLRHRLQQLREALPGLLRALPLTAAAALAVMSALNLLLFRRVRLSTEVPLCLLLAVELALTTALPRSFQRPAPPHRHQLRLYWALMEPPLVTCRICGQCWRLKRRMSLVHLVLLCLTLGGVFALCTRLAAPQKLTSITPVALASLPLTVLGSWAAVLPLRLLQGDRLAACIAPEAGYVPHSGSAHLQDASHRLKETDQQPLQEELWLLPGDEREYLRPETVPPDPDAPNPLYASPHGKL